MKKLVMPLMAISLLVSCNNGNKTIERTVSFNIPDCKMYYGDTEIKSSGTKIEIPDVNPYYVKFSVKADDSIYMKPSVVILDKTTEYSFNKDNGDLFINLQSNLNVTGTCDMYKTLEECTWLQIKTISEAGEAKKAFRIGDTKTVLVNDQPHKVRIIDFDHDIDSNDKKIGITFEFANLISDKQGYSLGTQWNDTNESSGANYNYLDSSIRKTLTNEGSGHILWAQKMNTSWSGDYKKSILEMLPNELTNVLVAPQKTVQCCINKEWTSKPIINNNGEYDKLFLLSDEEIGYEDTREGAYAYYQESDDDKIKLLRIKKQVNETEVLTDSSNIASGQVYQGNVFNYAGYNHSADETGGGYYWLRSPNIKENDRAWGVRMTGFMGCLDRVYVYANSVAPAFCI